MEFDLPEIVKLIREDLEELQVEGQIPAGYYGVRLVRHRRAYSHIIITHPGTRLLGQERETIYQLAKSYVRPEWHQYKQQTGLNFLPVIK